MRTSTLLAACLVLALAYGEKASAIVIATTDHFQVSAENIHPVGAGAAGENLRAFTLTVTNVSGDPNGAPVAIDTDPQEGFTGGIFGNFHQHWMFGGFLPTPHKETIVGLEAPESDTHFLVSPQDTITFTGLEPREDNLLGTSTEPASMPFEATGFGTYLKGTFLDQAAEANPADVWELAHIVMPAGWLEFDALLAGGWHTERVTGSAWIALPGDNFPPIVEAGGPYAMIDADGGGSVQFAGTADDSTGQIDSVQWEVARHGEDDWLTLPNGADTLTPVLTEYELLGMFGPELNINDMFDVRLTATDNLGAIGQDMTTLTFIPEPSTWLLLVLGSGGMWFWRRR